MNAATTPDIEREAIALQQKLPFVQLIESSGGNLRKFDVLSFHAGGMGAGAVPM